MNTQNYYIGVRCKANIYQQLNNLRKMQYFSSFGYKILSGQIMGYYECKAAQIHDRTESCACTSKQQA
ncbi:hypothetical protein C2845_PM04G06180 [Panicum miliaceum]|uniref:Uncharacterized protein n=1 Tax=Panicum miliaceum TaxID=4540 RepID=A0A3L6QMD5_PANMI|nr:hypothetical protein C2845_PM04G06180 [Panicum miliaceum]